MSKLTKQEFIALRDDMELNWDDSMRSHMQVLSLACINRFGVLLSKLDVKSESKPEEKVKTKLEKHREELQKMKHECYVNNHRSFKK